MEGVVVERVEEGGGEWRFQEVYTYREHVVALSDD